MPQAGWQALAALSRWPPRALWAVGWLAFVARKLAPEAHFVVAGSSRGSADAAEQLEVLVDKLRVKNMMLKRGVPRRRLVDFYEEAEVYLRPPLPERFGIAIAEGAAAGACPWCTGTARLDGHSVEDRPILRVHQCRRGGDSRSLLGDGDLWLRLTRRSVEVARDFSWGSYKRELDAVVREAYELKRRSKAGRRPW